MEPDERRRARWGVRFGLVASRMSARRPIEELLESRRESGPFSSLADVFARTDSKNLTRGAAECLIKAGALDSLGRRSQLLRRWIARSRMASSSARCARSGRTACLAGGWRYGDDDFTLPDRAGPPAGATAGLGERVAQSLSLSASALPCRPALKRRVTTYTAHLNEEWAGQKVTLGGRVTEAHAS